MPNASDLKNLAAQANLVPTVWVYDGTPEYLALNVEPASSIQGGYVLALELATRAIRLAATRCPAKYVTAWRLNAKRYGASDVDVTRVLVAGPFLRYEALKRSLVGRVAQYKDQGANGYRLPQGVEGLTALVKEMGDVAGVCFGRRKEDS
jgi:hypothetical protein